jgi:glutamyl-tRNA synthetase
VVEAVYRDYLKKLIDGGFAYISKEEAKVEGGRDEVIRFKNPNKVVSFTDIIRGEVTFDTTELKDFVIAKSLEEPLYHLAVVVDDHEMGVTHVIRGEDHISNTPRQILIQEAIGAKRPVYGHIPLILAPDRSKLSKRHGATSVVEYRERGYLPEAILNYLALLGWNPGTEQEVFTLPELINAFDILKVQKGGAIFDEEKLKWINKEHLKKWSEADLEKEIMSRILNSETAKTKDWTAPVNSAGTAQFVKATFERVSYWKDLEDLILAGDLNYFFEAPQYPKEKLLWKDEKENTATIRHLEKALEVFEKIPEENWNTETIKESLWNYANEEGRGAVLWPVRFSLSGRDKSPDPFTLASIVGKKEALARLSTAREALV